MPGITPYKVGDIFGNKKIVEYCGSDPKHRVSLWKYECLLCGAVTGPVRTGTITRKDRMGSMPKCCHPRNMLGSNNPKWAGHEELPLTYFKQVKWGAERRGLQFNITIENMWDQWLTQAGRCAYTGRQLRLGYKDTDASLDRKDSSIGYTTDNIQWIHKDVNRMKSALSEDNFLALCREVANNGNS